MEPDIWRCGLLAARAQWYAAPVLLVELGCVAVIAFYWAMHRRQIATLAPRAAVIAVAAWVGEQTCMRVYGAYEYSDGWHLFLGRVPVLVAVIWPLVVQSAQALARRAWPRATPVRRALATGIVVMCDAAFIEPVAVHAGLWRWTDRGVLGVPLVGIAGWGFFAAAITYALDRTAGSGARVSSAFAHLVAVVAAPLATHAMLLASWWGAFRWLSHPVPDAGAVAVVGCVSVVVTLRAARRDPSEPLPLREMLARLAAAAFFFALLARAGSDSPLLVAYALLFAPPHVLLLARSIQSAAPGRPSARQT